MLSHSMLSGIEQRGSIFPVNCRPRVIEEIILERIVDVFAVKGEH